MSPFTKIVVAALVNLSLITEQTLGQLPLVRFELPDFEPWEIPQRTEGFDLADGWAHVTPPGEGFEGSQGLKILKSAKTVVTKRIDWDAAQKTAFIDLRIKPSIDPQGSPATLVANGSQVAFQRGARADEGAIWALHGSDGGAAGSKWFAAAGAVPWSEGSGVASNWLRVTLRQDLERGVWDLFVDGKLALANLAFEGREAVPGSLKFYGSGEGDTLLDDVAALPDNMLFADADKDGLPDAWERAHGSDPDRYDREETGEGGKRWLDAYLADLWPAGAATGSVPVLGQSSIPPLTILGRHEPVGALKGSFSVGGDGSASYSIPIDVPKGTGGMEPKLSLSYSSSGGNGVAGLGFSLSGLQSITRGASSHRKDGFSNPVDFEADDRFYLNGERLVCVGGTYGAAGSEYRTEIDSFARIRLEGDATGRDSSWKVETKAGLTMWFGTSPDSKVCPPSAKAPVTWEVARVSDSAGNYYEVRYASDAAAGPGELVNHRVDRILYTGNTRAGTAPYCSVRFDYESRPDSSFAYLCGLKMVSSLRLSSVAVETGGVVNHRYRLAYQASAQTGRSLLSSVTKEVNGMPVPATTIDWDTLQAGEPKWKKVERTSYAQYGTWQEASSDDSNAYISSGEEGRSIFLGGDVSRAVVLPGGPVTIAADTVVEFEFRGANWDFGAVLALDDDLTESNTTKTLKGLKMVTVEGPPCAVRLGGTGANVPWIAEHRTDVGANWTKVVFPVGKYRSGGTGRYLALMNCDDVTTNQMSWSEFRNVRIYRLSDPAGAGASVSFDTQGEIPRLMKASNGDRGIQLVDLDGDGLLDLIESRLMTFSTNSSTDWPNRKLLMNTQQMTMRGTAGGFVHAPHLNVPPDVVFSISTDETVSTWNARHALTARFTDINADGCPDLYVPRVQGHSNHQIWMRYEFLTLRDGSWAPMSGYNDTFPFATLNTSGKNNGGTPSLIDHELIDMNGDGYLDLVVATSDAGSLMTPDFKKAILPPNSRTVFLNRVHEGKGWVREDRLALPEPIREYVDGSIRYRQDSMLRDLNGDSRPDYTMAKEYAFVVSKTRTGEKMNYRRLAKSYILSPEAEPFVRNWMPKVSGGGAADTPWSISFDSFDAKGPWICPSPYISRGNGTILSDYKGSDPGTRVIDLNGDGLPELLRSTGFAAGDDGWKVMNYAGIVNTSEAWINKGAGVSKSSAWLESEPFRLPVSLNALDGGHPGVEFTDLNGDGLVDLLVAKDHGTTDIWKNLFGGTSKGAYINAGRSWSEDATWAIPDGHWLRSGNAPVSAQIADLNGDGFPDLITNITGAGIPVIYLNQCRPEVVRALTDGFGSRLEVEYRRLNDPSLTPGFGACVYEKGTGPLPEGQSRMIDSRLVVSRYSEPDGLGGRRYQSRRYGDLRYDRLNEASLGFGWIEALDESNGQRSRTEMMREYPFAGSPVLSESYVLVSPSDVGPGSIYPGVTPGLKLMTQEFASYGELPPLSGIGGQIRRPVQTQAVKHTFDLDGTLKISTVTTQGLEDFDAYGFVKKSTVRSLDGMTITTESTFDHWADAQRWHLGRLAASKVTKSQGQQRSVKNASFEYSPSTGLLTRETVEPGHPLAVSKSYTHDLFGNVVTNEVTASGQSRRSVSTFDSWGRFALRQTNALGQSASSTYDSTKALLLATTDAAGLTTHFHYDAFGTLIRTELPGGTQSAEITGYATKETLPASVAALVPGIVRYFRSTETSGAPPATAYFDAMGRELVTETTYLKDATAIGEARYAKAYVVTQYDWRGRKIGVSNPFAPGEPPAFSWMTYDLLDRALVTLYPDHGIERIQTYGIDVLDGQPVTYSKVQNRNGKTLERWEDQHGRFIQSRDPSGQLTRFTHDLEGQMTSVSVGGQKLLSNTFDLLGNKTAVWEANSGTSTSSYNGFGEVVSSTNAKGETTTFQYDVLGRATVVAKPEGTYRHFYDGARGNGTGQAWKTTGPSGYHEEVCYDSLGRVTHTFQLQFGERFTTATTYDGLGRRLTHTDAGGLTVAHTYDPRYSIPVAATLAGGTPGAPVYGAGTVLWRAGQFDSSGKAVTQTLAQGVTVSARYDAANGNLLGLCADRGAERIQDKAYTWDTLGNLSRRDDFLAKHTETFGYDSLNRLVSSAVSAHPGHATTSLPPPASYRYDIRGNLLTKGSATLEYGGPAPHAVTRATVKGLRRDYLYDSDGYVLSDSKRRYSWTSFHQLATLSYQDAPALRDLVGNELFAARSIFTTFDFDAAGNRVRQTKERYGPGFDTDLETVLYLGSYERETRTTVAAAGDPRIRVAPEIRVIHRHSLPGGTVYTRTESNYRGTIVKLTTVLKDHLGSTDVLLTSQWAGTAFVRESIERQSFDAWGERRHAASLAPGRISDSDPFLTSGQPYDRGYTGHEQLDDSGLIHMNGRIYDPELGRFLAPDPFVQVPEYSQNFNRYSYVLNNPLNATDPSGFFLLGKIFHAKKKFLKENWRTIVVIVVVAVVTIISAGSLSAGAAGVGAAILGETAAAAVSSAVGSWAVAAVGGAFLGGIAGGLSAALAGGDLGDILRGALVGGVQGAITSGGLHTMGEAAATTSTRIDDVGHVVGHGVVGGAANVAMGGKFEDGFLSAAAGAAAGYLGAYRMFQGSGGWQVAGRTAVAGVIGGTVSALGGGKFSNGAYTAAFQHFLNAELSAKQKSEVEELKSEGGSIRGYFDRKRGIIGLYDEKNDVAIIRMHFESGHGEGMNNPSLQHVQSDATDGKYSGPLPAGDYRIVFRSGEKPGVGYWQGAKNIYKGTGEPGYKLLALDSSATNDSVFAGSGVTRGLFRLHAGTGIGCITCRNYGQYRDVAAFIERSGSRSGSYGWINVY